MVDNNGVIVLDDTQPASQERENLPLSTLFSFTLFSLSYRPVSLNALSRSARSLPDASLWCALRVCICACVGAIIVTFVWEGGRQTFKSTPPQSNYRPGHGTQCPYIIYGSCRVPCTEAISLSYVGHGGQKGAGRGGEGGGCGGEPREIVARAYRC